MINFIEKNNKLNSNVSSLTLTYPRTIEIIFGNYPYPDKIHNFLLAVKSNLNKKLENFTNVKGGMTDWKYFIDKVDFINFISFIINKYQSSHKEMFQYFLEKYCIEDAWGNEIKKGDYLEYHSHDCYHGILYLTKGCDLILPELNLKITPEPGDYYIFPPFVLHGFDKNEEQDNRYSLIFNIKQSGLFNFEKKLNKIK